jgi:hypothetical protein
MRCRRVPSLASGWGSRCSALLWPLHLFAALTEERPQKALGAPLARCRFGRRLLTCPPSGNAQARLQIASISGWLRTRRCATAEPPDRLDRHVVRPRSALRIAWGWHCQHHTVVRSGHSRPGCYTLNLALPGNGRTPTEAARDQKNRRKPCALDFV